jgi:hypothetical protein
MASPPPSGTVLNPHLPYTRARAHTHTHIPARAQRHRPHPRKLSTFNSCHCGVSRMRIPPPNPPPHTHTSAPLVPSIRAAAFVGASGAVAFDNVTGDRAPDGLVIRLINMQVTDLTAR